MPLPHVDPSAVAPLCWLHGFTQTGHSAHRFRSILAGQREVIAPDLLRHGSNWDRGGSLDEIADAVVVGLPDGVVDLGGYSFGGRVALHVALRHPERIRRLVLIGATRGIREDTERNERRHRDEALAERIELMGAAAFVDEWLRQPMFAGVPADPVERAAREDQHASSLAASLREAGTGTQRWLGGEVASISAPTLALAGSRDDRFAREASCIANSVGGVFSLVPGSGHAAHLEQPQWTAVVVDAFLSASVDRPDANRQSDPE